MEAKYLIIALKTAYYLFHVKDYIVCCWAVRCDSNSVIINKIILDSS